MQTGCKRFLNIILILFSYFLSRFAKRAYHHGMPVSAGIEPNNTCNLHCPECPAGTRELTRPQGFMDPALFRSAIDQLSPHLAYLTLYFQGEPYLSKKLFDYIAYARSRKIYVATSTNGHFFNETTVKQTIDSGLNRLIISLDGFDQQSYGQYRKGGDFGKVIDGIRLLVSEKKKLNSRHPEIILQCLILRTNEHHLDEIKKLGRELGVNQTIFKTAQFNDFKDGNPLMPENLKYARYREKVTKSQSHKVGEFLFRYFDISIFHPLTISPSSRFTIKNHLPNSCFRMWSSCVITWDGKVVPCCFDKDATNLLGELKKQSFKEIWNGKLAHDFRQKVLQNRKGIEICSNCSQTF